MGKNFFERTLPNGKTYLAAIGLVASAIGGYMTGDLDLMQAIALALDGLGFAGLRAAVKG